MSSDGDGVGMDTGVGVGIGCGLAAVVGAAEGATLVVGVACGTEACDCDGVGDEQAPHASAREIAAAK
jgi:hypothetical protein